MTFKILFIAYPLIFSNISVLSFGFFMAIDSTAPCVKKCFIKFTFLILKQYIIKVIVWIGCKDTHNNYFIATWSLKQVCLKTQVHFYSNCFLTRMLNHIFLVEHKSTYLKDQKVFSFNKNSNIFKCLLVFFVVDGFSINAILSTGTNNPKIRMDQICLLKLFQNQPSCFNSNSQDF